MFTGNLLHLLHLCDTALPIGGFAHSAGLETYVQERVVHDRKTAKDFTTQQLSYNICYTDAALVSLAFNAAANKNIGAVIHLDELCNAVKLAKEMRLASNKLGTRLLKIFQHNASLHMVTQYRCLIQNQQAFGHYSIAFGLIANELHIAKQDALTGFYYNAASGFITNAVKLIPLGQQDGQEMLIELFPLLRELTLKSLLPDEDMIGYCCPGFDIRCMQHEQLYSRLYMS